MQEVLTAGNNQALNTFLVIVIMLSCILICLTVHEFGHFAFAKLFKVNVKEFSIGFGPAIFKTYTKKNYMQITIRLLPIGAYVLLDSAAVRRIYLEEPNSNKYNFYLRPKPYGTLLLEQAKYWQQMIIMFGGILFNIITFSLVLGLWSALNPQAVLNFGAFLKNLFITIGQAFVLYGLWPGQGGGGSGVPPITQQMPDFDFFLRYLISLNLATAILNFLVVPPLDGWKIMLFSYEKITKKKLPENVLTIVSIIGSVLLLWITIGSIINSFAIKS